MNGWWAIAETGQGGGLPDTLHGPYWDQEQAADIAREMAEDSRRRGRRDDYVVVKLVIQDDAR